MIGAMAETYRTSFSTPATRVAVLPLLWARAQELKWSPSGKRRGGFDVTTGVDWRHNRPSARISIEVADAGTGSVVELVATAAGKHRAILDPLLAALPAGSRELSYAEADALLGSHADDDEGGEVVASVEALPRRVRRTAEQHIAPGERILFALVGAGRQTLVAFADRVLILKPGLLANTTFGCRATTIAYRDITGIQVNTGALMGVLEVSSPSYQARPADYWQAAIRGNEAGSGSPYVIPNCIPVAKSQLGRWSRELAELRRRIGDARAPAAPQAAAPPLVSVADELGKLGRLHAEGVLTDDEFAAAKARLLGRD
jgi:hypothetical protein